MSKRFFRSAASCQCVANSASLKIAKAAGEKYGPAVVPTKFGNSLVAVGAVANELQHHSKLAEVPSQVRSTQKCRPKKFGQLRWAPWLIRLSHLLPDAIKKLSASRFIQSVRIIGCDFDLLSSIARNWRKRASCETFSLPTFQSESISREKLNGKRVSRVLIKSLLTARTRSS
jgi:hypothetical protein